MAKTKSSERRKKAAQSEELVPEEILAAVGRYFCRGFSPAEIAEKIEKEYRGIEMKRETPYKLIQQAAKNDMLRFIAKGDDDLSGKITNEFNLQKAEVVFTNHVDDVARRAASMALEMIGAFTRPPKSQKTVRIGFAGGNSIRLVAQYLAQLLRQHTQFLPDHIVLQALVPGVDIRTPITDPNLFFSYFLEPAFHDPSKQAESEKKRKGSAKQNGQMGEELESKQQFQFVMLQAPAFVTQKQYESIASLEAITLAIENAKKLDIIVGSAADIDDDHSMVQEYYLAKYPSLTDVLKPAQCTGDMFWLPIGPRGPIDLGEFPIRSMTLIGLEDLPARIGAGQKVILVLGPCARCNRPKAGVLKSILENKTGPLITHLVCDSRSARGLFDPAR